MGFWDFMFPSNEQLRNNAQQSNSDWLTKLLFPGNMGPDALMRGAGKDPNVRQKSGGGSFRRWDQHITDPINRGIQGGLASMLGQLKPKQPTIEDILQDLQNASDPSRYMTDSADLQQQARSAAEAQYGPLIASLRNQMGQAQDRGWKQHSQLGDMFSSLSNNLRGGIPQIQQQFAETKQETQGAYDQLKQTIGNQYAESAKQQEEMYKRLNIEAAAPEVMSEQFRDKDFFTNIANTQGQTQQAALGQEERGATEYTRRNSEVAQIEGTQRQAGLMDQLSQLMSGFESQIGAHEAAKEQAYSSGLGSLQSQAQEQAQKSAQRDFDNLLQSMQIGRMLRKDEFDMQGGAGQFPSVVKSPGDVAGRLMGLGVSEPDAQSAFNSLIGSVGQDELIGTGVDPSTQLPLTKEALARRVVEEGQRQGLPPDVLNALQIAALEYFGRR